MTRRQLRCHFDSDDPRVQVVLRQINEIPEGTVAREEAEACLYTFLAAVCNRRIGEMRAKEKQG